MQTPEGFKSLAELLRAGTLELPVRDDTPPALSEPPRGEIEAARAVRLFRAQLAEALDAAIETLCNDIATEIVGRELSLAPADMQTIVQRALARYSCENHVRVRLHPEDARACAQRFDVTADETLRRGDAILEVGEGSIDASLGVRLEALLKAVR